MAGDAAPLVWAIGGYAGTAAASAGFRAGFLLLTGRIGQDVLLDVRRRVFAHGQRLSLDFHERFTSGRFISRLTSDVDALNDLLEKGLDGFGGAVLSLVGISVLLVWLDPVLAVIVLAGFVPLLLLTRWFQRRSRATYRRTRVTVARLIVQFVESMNGIRAVQAYRREERNDEIMDGLGAAYRDANADDDPHGRVVRRGAARGRQPHAGAACSPSAGCGWRAVRWSWARSPRSCSTCGGSTTRSTSWRSSSTPTSRRPRRWRRSPRCSTRLRTCRSPPRRWRCRRRCAGSCGSRGCGSPTGPTGGAPCCPSCR